MSEIDLEIVKSGKMGDLHYTTSPGGLRMGKCGDAQNPADAESLTGGRFKGKKLRPRITRKSRGLEALAMLVFNRRA